ncbi:hypothetical protein T05_1302 [Trichinella murrelli]|uniref:Uncharacterized protein n=1 Tax=Trichinella murrelli TaxID=144512 RepID=A0A0V0TPN2_9BILA|nr:hypothetical protein T05_1302 [Trichinella murrelli]
MHHAGHDPMVTLNQDVRTLTTSGKDSTYVIAGTRRFRRLSAGRKATGIAVATLHGLASHIHYPATQKPYAYEVIRPWITAATVTQVDHHISVRCSSQTFDSYRRLLKRDSDRCRLQGIGEVW